MIFIPDVSVCKKSESQSLKVQSKAHAYKQHDHNDFCCTSAPEICFWNKIRITAVRLHKWNLMVKSNGKVQRFIILFSQKPF